MPSDSARSTWPSFDSKLETFPERKLTSSSGFRCAGMTFTFFCRRMSHSRTVLSSPPVQMKSPSDENFAVVRRLKCLCGIIEASSAT